MDLTRGEGADVVFECAGFLPAVPEGFGYVKQDGKFIECGHFVDIGEVPINPARHILIPNIRVEGIWGSRFPHFVRGHALLEQLDLPIGEMVSHVLPLERARDGFNALNGTYSWTARMWSRSPWPAIRRCSTERNHAFLCFAGATGSVQEPRGLQLLAGIRPAHPRAPMRIGCTGRVATQAACGTAHGGAASVGGSPG